jgi:hypothetical protein
LCLSQANPWISSFLLFFFLQWFEVRGSCSLCWY